LFHLIECDRKGKCLCDVKFRGYNKMIIHAIRCLKKNNLKPIASEVPVLAGGYRIATALDMICESTDINPPVHTIISVKTGGSQEWRAFQHFNPPLDFIDLNPKNINQLQSACELALLRRQGIIPNSYATLHINAINGISLETPDEWIYDSTIHSKILKSILTTNPNSKPRSRSRSKSKKH